MDDGHDHGPEGHGGEGGEGGGEGQMGGNRSWEVSYYPRMYWAVIGAAIALATLVNVADVLLYRQRYGHEMKLYVANRLTTV